MPAESPLLNKQNPKRKKTLLALLLSLLIIGAFLLGLVLRISRKVEFDETTAPTSEAENTDQELTKGPIDHRGTVIRVIDGDTIELEGGERIRYLGINTPEKGRLFSTEAIEANDKLVADREVELELDAQAMDKYGRTLAYVWVGETMVNLELVRRGFASVYTFPPNIKYESYFLAAEEEAREAQRGLWQSF